MAGLALEDRAFFKLLDWGFEAMAVRECHRKATKVSRKQKREPQPPFLCNEIQGVFYWNVTAVPEGLLVDTRMVPLVSTAEFVLTKLIAEPPTVTKAPPLARYGPEPSY